MFLNKKITAIFLFVLAVFLFILDRFLKFYALYHLSEYKIIGDILKFNFAKNYYIAFSLPLGGDFLLILIALILTILFGYSVKLAKKQEFIQVALLTNIIFGAISNLLDRCKYGYVVDYIDLKYFTVFNVADSMIVVSVFLLLIMELKVHKGDKFV